MNLKLIRIAFRIFKMIKFTITIHAGGLGYHGWTW